MRLAILALISILPGMAQRQTTPAATAHIGKGYELEQSDRFAEAAEEFRAALALDPQALNARYQLAVCLFALGERDQSHKQFAQLETATKGDPGPQYYLARLDMLAGDHASAIRRLAPLMASPPFPDAAFYLGSAYLAQGDFENAVKWLRKAARADPHDFRCHYRLARALQQAGRRKEAEQEYALSTQARERYNETARQSTTCSQALESQPIDAARATCNRLFDPNDPDKLTMLGILYGEKGKYQEAIDPLDRAAALDPDSFEVYHNLGLTYFRLKRYADARSPLEKAVRLRPDFFGSNALLGATLYLLKDDDAAFRVLDFAHRLKPEDTDTAELFFRECVILADRSVAAGDYAGSLKYLEQAAAARPGAPGLDQRITATRSHLPQSR